MIRTQEEIAYDQRLGQRLRLSRQQCGLSKQELADTLGGLFTAQLVHAYEMGTQSVSVGHLAHLAETLGAAPYLLMHDLPFADASDWHFHSQYQTLDRNTQNAVRGWITHLASESAIMEQ